MICMRRHLTFLYLWTLSCSWVHGEWNHRLLNGEKVTGRVGTMVQDRIPVTPAWSTEALWIPVQQLFVTELPAPTERTAFAGYHVLFTNQDRVYSSSMQYNGEWIGIRTGWGMENQVKPDTLQSIWLSSPASTGKAKWHMVMPETSWWFHLERGKHKPMQVDWKRAEDGSWVFGRNRMSSGLHLPQSDKGLEVEMDMGKSTKNFRIRFVRSFEELKNNSNSGTDFILNSSQVMFRHKRKMIFRKIINQEFPDVRRFRMEYNIVGRKARLWINDQFLTDVEFPDDFHPEVPHLLVLEPYAELRLTHFAVTPILKQAPAELDQLWLNDGKRILGRLQSWNEEHGIGFLEEKKSAPVWFDVSSVMGIRFSAADRQQVKRNNRDILIQFPDGFSRLHLPLDSFSESSLGGKHSGWAQRVEIPLTQIQMIRWNPYTPILQDPVSPLSQWAGEGRK